MDKIVKQAVICYIKQDNKTLMLYRNKKENDYHRGKWNGVGGKLEQGETPQEAVIREVKEETNLIVKNPFLKGMITFPLFSNNEDWYVYLFEAYKFTGNITKNCKEGELFWVNNNEIKDLSMWEGDAYFLKWMESNSFFSGKIIYKNGVYIENKVDFYSFNGD